MNNFQLEHYRLNIHGHIHERVIDDPRYVNVSVEQISYRPVALARDQVG